MKQATTRQRITRAAATLAAPRRALVLALTLIAALTVQTAWADDYPAYITDVMVIGGDGSTVDSKWATYQSQGYKKVDFDLNSDAGGDYVYVLYKTGSRNSTDGGYITDLVVSTTDASSVTYNGTTYTRVAHDGSDHFKTYGGNLNSSAKSGSTNMWIFYTKKNFSDKRAVNDIVVNTSSSKSGYTTIGKNGGSDAYDLNEGAGGDYVYMHFSTTTKRNRPASDPTMKTGLVYTGQPLQLVNYNPTSQCTMYYRVGTSGSYTSTVSDITATNAGTHTVYYYAATNSYGDYGPTLSQTVTISKAANSGVTVACADVVDGNAPAPQLGGTNLSTGAVTYQYSTTQNGTYTTTVPTDFGKYWVKATIAGDDNCYAYTTAAVSFWILSDANDLWNIRGGANGTVDHPIVISTPSQLDLLAKKVNGTDGYTANNYSGKYFELGADITYDGTENNYTPIGSDGTEFGGHFDGKGHTVSGININLPSNNYIGLFGKAIESTTIQNLALDNSRIAGYSYCGGIVGYNSGGTVDNCHVTSSVTILAPNSGAEYHGGIVGRNGSGIVRGCTSAATLKYDDTLHSYYGGIAGYNHTSGTIRDCLVYGGSVSGTYRVGAVVGYNSGTLTNNHYTGVMLNGSEAGLDKGVGGDGSQDGTSYICAIIPYEGVTLSIPSVSATTEYPYDGLKIYPTGMTYKGQYYNYISNADAGISGDVTFTATYSGSVPEDYALGGFGSTSIADNTDVAMKWAATGSSATCTLCTYIANPYYIAPTFRYAIWGDGDGTQANPYIITTVSGMNELASRVNSGEDLGGKYFELGADITYDGTGNNYTPIGTSDHHFSANFDGKGYTISGININTSSDCQGIFGFAANCTIQDLTLANSTITNGGTSGGIFGKGDGVTVSNCHVTNTVTLHATGIDLGGIGGFAMYNSTIQGCTSAAKLSFKWNYDNGGIMGGMNRGTIKDCLYLGPKFDTDRNGAILGYITQNAPTITNSYHISYGMNAIGYESMFNTNFAVATTDKPEGASATATATYGSGSYTGITVFGNVLYYDGKYYWHVATIEIADHSNENSITFSEKDGQTCNVVLKDRTLYKDGSWNTICLPFDVDMTDPDCPLYGATYRTVTDASISGTTLSLTFAEKRSDGWADNTIRMGVPYIIKWDKANDYVDDDAHNIVNPVFTNVEIQYVGTDFWNGDALSNSTVAFCGTYNAITNIADKWVDASVNGAGKPFDVLLLGADNTLRYAGSGASLGACRAYFLVDPAAVEAGASRLTSFSIDFGEGEATAIKEIGNSQSSNRKSPDVWYSLNGVRLSGKPTQRGIYINNGKKVVIK